MGFAAVWVAAIGMRLVNLQVKQHDSLLARAEHQQLTSVDLAPVRGMIYDRNNREIAGSIQVKSLYALPDQIKNPSALAQKLASILDLDKAWVLKRLSMKQGNIAIKRKLSDDEMSAVQALHEPGLRFVNEQKRYYVDGTTAAQLVGFVDIDERGQGGIELSLDKLVRGESGKLTESVDALKNAYDHQMTGGVPGNNVTLTIDSAIQSKAAAELEAAVKEHHAKGGTIVIVKPSTGEVLAMADYPTFDPNNVSDSTTEQRLNRAVETAFEPGSIFKLVTYSAALEEGKITPDTRIDIGNGTIQVLNHTVHDESRGVLTAAQALAKSSNVAAIKLGHEIGGDKLAEYVEKFGFGKRTGIDLPGESKGLVHIGKVWDEAALGSVPMGYGVGVTALQAVSAFACIANGGEYIDPYVISSVVSPDGHLLQQHRDQRRRVVSSKTAATLKSMLEGVVIHGTGKLAQLGGYSAAGKTGTARKIDRATGGYSRTRYVASFVGFAPVENPQIACIVSIDEPEGKYFGGDVSAPVFARVASETLQLMGVEPQSQLPADMFVADLHTFQLPEIVIQPEQTLQPEPSQGAPVAEVVTSAAPNQGPGSKPRVPEGDTSVPDLIGLGIRGAADLCASRGLKLKAYGEGRVVQQTPAAGVMTNAGTVCQVTLSRQTVTDKNAAAVAVRWQGASPGDN